MDVKKSAPISQWHPLSLFVVQSQSKYKYVNTSKWKALQNTHPRHKLNKYGEFLLLEVPQTTIVLNDPLVTQILQQLNLTLQSIHLLQRKKASSKSNTEQIWMLETTGSCARAVSDFIGSLSPCWFPDSPDQRAPASRPAHGLCRRRSRGIPPRMRLARGAFLVASWLAPVELQKNNTTWWKKKKEPSVINDSQRQ